jgi:thiamine-monophosphate kinase
MNLVQISRSESFGIRRNPVYGEGDARPLRISSPATSSCPARAIRHVAVTKPHRIWQSTHPITSRLKRNLNVMPSEFDLIRRHFTHPTRHTALGVGDDAALLQPGAGMQLAVSTDMLVCGTHFLPDTDPQALGWKALAVNLSDLAAMGAMPRWAFLALALPTPDETWIEAFAHGLLECAAAFDVDLAGGDTTRGPLNLCITVVGEVPDGAAITRDGAGAGDDIWVTGQPGCAALGLAALRGEIDMDAAAHHACVSALQRPQPRVAAGLALRGIASAMLDVSDGLLGDLRHILERSGMGATIDVAALPLTTLLSYGISPESARAALCGGGDDYELAFTAPPARRAAIAALATRLDLAFTRIGTITPACDTLLLREPDGRLTPAGRTGYDHFSHAPNR